MTDESCSEADTGDVSKNSLRCTSSDPPSPRDPTDISNSSGLCGHRSLQNYVFYLQHHGMGGSSLTIIHTLYSIILSTIIYRHTQHHCLLKILPRSPGIGAMVSSLVLILLAAVVVLEVSLSWVSTRKCFLPKVLENQIIVIKRHLKERYILTELN